MQVVDQNGAVQLVMADLSDEIQPFKISHLPRTDFELCILDMFNMLSVPSTCVTSGVSTSTSWTCSRCVPSTRHRKTQIIMIIILNYNQIHFLNHITSEPHHNHMQ